MAWFQSLLGSIVGGETAAGAGASTAAGAEINHGYLGSSVADKASGAGAAAAAAEELGPWGKFGQNMGAFGMKKLENVLTGSGGGGTMQAAPMPGGGGMGTMVNPYDAAFVQALAQAAQPAPQPGAGGAGGGQYQFMDPATFAALMRLMGG